ncbi:hypothetical protein C2G38_2148262 [Gigaspora rosea]|uniref:Trypsin-like cysteine/serine peptidase domain-containing protein n=1 Tax=Gigaspora rosea TaxID=44941 RepID=A0A397UB73_9GLOM|nr:hypothetical protein C2G38_2148262 [Gigaspora rosea]
MKYIYYLLFIFTFQKYLMIDAREPLAELWDIQDNDILEYLARESHLTMVDRTLKRFLDELNFAETYINVANNSIIVYSVNMSKIPEIISKPEIEQYKQFLDFRKVNNSLASLKSSFNELAILAKENKPTSIMFGILPKLNKIVVVVDHIRRRRREFQILRAFIFSAERHGAEIFYVDSSSGKLHAKRGLCCGKLTTEVLSGDGIYNEFYRSLCSAGFWARRKDKSQTLLITAGHCDLENHPSESKMKFVTWNTTRPEIIGELVYSSEAPHDFALIDIKKMSNRLCPLTNIKNNLDSQLTINDDVLPASSYGTHLCRSGVYSPVSCGYVEGFNMIHVSKSKIVKTDSIFVSIMISESGDSGGPSFSFSSLTSVTLKGILWGGSSEGRSPLGLYSLILPLEIILNNTNLELITSRIVPR